MRSSRAPDRFFDSSNAGKPFWLPARILKLTDPDLAIGKYGANLEMAAESVDILDQGADADVCAVLDLRDLALVHAEDFTELQLCHLTNFSERIEGHEGETLLKPLLDLLASGGRHRLDQLPEIASWH